MWHKSAKLEFISDEAITISLSRDCDRRLRYKFNAMFNCLSRPNVGKNRDSTLFHTFRLIRPDQSEYAISKREPHYMRDKLFRDTGS